MLLALWMWIPVTLEAVRYQRVYNPTQEPDFSIPRETVAEIGRHLSEQERFLLFGDLAKHPKSEQLRARWQSEPDNVAYFADCADPGAPDFLVTARRLEPENAWFTYRAAGAMARDTVIREKLTAKARKAGEIPKWQILDHAKLDRALACLREAAHQPQFVNHRQPLTARRAALLPKADHIARFAAESYQYRYFYYDSSVRYLSHAIAAKAWQAGEAGDTAEFRRLLTDANAVLAAYAKQPAGSAIDALLVSDALSVMIPYLHNAAVKLELASEAGELAALRERLRKWRAAKNAWADGYPEHDLLAMRGSLPGRLVLAGTAQQTPEVQLTDSELKPGRMVDHLLAARISSALAWLGLGVAVLAAWGFSRREPKFLPSARRMNNLLRPVDWGWIVGIGVALPFGYVTGLSRFTPLGGQDWSICATGRMLPAADYLAMLLLLLVMPVLMIRWRLQRRVGGCGIGNGVTWLGWTAVGLAALLVPAVGMLLPVTSPPPNIYMIGLLPFMTWDLKQPAAWCLLLLVPLGLWILVGAMKALSCASSRRLTDSAVALALIPAYAVGMVFIMASMPCYKAAQDRWDRMDGLRDLTASGATRYETAVARQILAEIREVLQLPP